MSFRQFIPLAYRLLFVFLYFVQLGILIYVLEVHSTGLADIEKKLAVIDWRIRQLP